MAILTITLNPALDRIVSSGRSRTFSGGKGVNVARALGALGVPSVVFVAVAGDKGRCLVERLKKERFSPRVFRVSGETRTNTTFIQGRQVSRVFGAGPLWKKADVVRLGKTFERMVRRGDQVVISGSLPPGAPEDLYARLIGVAKKRGADVFLDAHGGALKEGLRARPSFVKPNREEAEDLLGRRLSSRRDIKKALQALGRRGMKEVFLTLGSQGLAATNGRNFFWVQGPRFQGHGVGCGDAALAGFIAGTMNGQDFSERLSLAAACGAAAAKAEKPGAIRIRDVEKIRQQIRIREF